MKHTILLYAIIFALIASYCRVLGEYPYSPQSHIFSIPQKIALTPHTNFPAQASINTRTRNYHTNYLTPAQQLNIINAWVKQYQASTISYVQLPSASPPTACAKVNEPTNPIIILSHDEPPHTTDLEDALHIQRLSPEWEKHSAILDARSNALEQIKNDNHSTTIQQHKLSRKMKRYCDAYDIQHDMLSQCSGTAIQHTIHNEFIDITKKTSGIWHKNRLPKSLHKTTRAIADFTHAGITYNNNNEIKNALLLTDACWMMLDCICATTEDLYDGAYHLVYDVMHPARTAQTIIESTAMCGYYIGKVAVEIGQLGYLVLAEPPQKIDEKLDTWKQNFSLIYNAIQEKCATLKTRDIVKESVSFGIQCYAAPKVLHGLGVLFKNAHKQVVTFAQNIPALKKTNVLTTPEGVIVWIADSAVEYMKNEQVSNIIKTNSATSSTKIHLAKKQINRTYLEIENPVLNNLRSGSALKQDALHAFNDIIDNYASYAKEFSLIGGDNCIYKLYQIEGSLNGKSGIFEWIIDPNPIKGVTHRRFIEGVPITGKPNAIKKRLS